MMGCYLSGGACVCVWVRPKCLSAGDGKIIRLLTRKISYYSPNIDGEEETR